METQEIIAKVRRLEIKSKFLTKQMFSGDYHSAFKGRGMSFAEVREYQAGDDVRNIDWNVTARTDTPHVKLFEEERELTVILMIDVSGSSYCGSDGLWKSDWIIEIAAVLAFSAASNHDKIGLLLFDSEVRLYMPPKKGRKQVLQIIHELVNQRPTHEGTDLGQALRYINNIHKRKAICFVLSDFVSKEYLVPLQVASRRHDLIGLMVHDRLESGDVEGGLIEVQDAESDHRFLLDLNDHRMRAAWIERFENHQAHVANLFKRSSSDLLTMPVGTPYIPVLHQFFKRRALRR